jgi:hypothetical protein
MTSAIHRLEAPPAPGPGSPARALRAILLPLAWTAVAYVAGIHVAAAAGALPDDAVPGAAPGPACVGCHHGGDDDGADPDDGLTSPERDALTRFRKETAR